MKNSEVAIWVLLLFSISSRTKGNSSVSTMSVTSSSTILSTTNVTTESATTTRNTTGSPESSTNVETTSDAAISSDASTASQTTNTTFTIISTTSDAGSGSTDTSSAATQTTTIITRFITSTEEQKSTTGDDKPTTQETESTTTWLSITTPLSTAADKITLSSIFTTSSLPAASLVLPICLTIFVIVLIICLFFLYCYWKGIGLFSNKKKRHEIIDIPPKKQSNASKFQLNHMAIHRDEFEIQFKRKSADDGRGYREEFRAIQTESSTLSVAKEQANIPKNRYDNVLPWDSSRVVLSVPPDGSDSKGDYINANFVPGYLQEKKFIACQGPKENTVVDFWRMIWDQKCSTIVMVTNLVEATKPKCDKYWPDDDSGDGEPTKYGDFIITTTDVKVRNFYTSRTLKLQLFDIPPRMIQQLHYTAWPDFGVPNNPHELLLFRRRVIAANPPHSGPIVVHCSAGVGRTGTFILIDAALEQLQAEGKADMFSFLTKMRKYRMMLVQTDAQYTFSHEAVLEHIKYGNTEVSIKESRNQVHSLREPTDNSEDNLLEAQFSALLKVQMNKENLKHGRQSIKKNRVLQIIPYDNNRVTLPLKPGQEKSDYINASFIDGFKQKHEYIATQGPLEETASDFWSMMWLHGSQNIVMLTGLVEKGHEMCFQYWPNAIDEQITFGDITVKYASKDDDDIVEYAIREFVITNNMVPDGGERKVRQFHYSGWPEVGLPSDAHGMIEISGRLISKNKDDQCCPIIVHCSSGGGRTGVFIGLNILMDQAENEGLVDVFQTVKSLRAQRPHVIQTQEQLYFCYVALLQYLETNQMTDDVANTYSSNLNSSVGGTSDSIAQSNGGIPTTSFITAETTTPQGSMNNKLDLNSLPDRDSINVDDKLDSFASSGSPVLLDSTDAKDNTDENNSASQSPVSDFEIVCETKENTVEM